MQVRTEPKYKVRVSDRAKHPRLKMSVRDGLIVVIPSGFDESRIPEIIERKQTWINSALQRAEHQRHFLSKSLASPLPREVHLRLIDEQWTVRYRMTDSGVVAAVEYPNNQLLLRGCIADKDAARASLRRWLARKTKSHVVPMLLDLARVHSLDVERVMVRMQRTRWASCSSNQIISVNVKLLFLPRPLVRYVLIHELAHLQDLNHSRSFWSHVASLEPNYKALDAELRTAWRLAPVWLSAGEARSQLSTC